MMDNKLTTLDWDDLRIFLAVAQAGTVRGAAKQVGKTHATVSRHIQSLETVLTNSLFERRREGQCLTELGQRVLPLARQVAETVSQIDRVAFSADTGLQGPVKLSLAESLYTALLRQPIDDFMQRYPMIDMDITANDKLSRLAWREADVVIRITKDPPETAYGKNVAASPLALYASKAYLEARPKRDRWIAYQYDPAKKPIIPARVVANVDTASLAMQMIGLGRGMGLLPCYLGNSDPSLIFCDDIALIPDMQIWILTHSDLRTNPRVRVLMDHLYAAFKKLRPAIEGVIKT